MDFDYSDGLKDYGSCTTSDTLTLAANKVLFRPDEKMPDSQTPLLCDPLADGPPAGACTPLAACGAPEAAGGIDNPCEGADSCASHSNDQVQRIDGAGEPCPTPLLWQEVREKYLSDSTPWEITRGPHRLAGRTWGQGPPLYFLNNFAATAELFSLVIWLLHDQFRCVVFDAVTNSRKEAIESTPTMSEFADDLFSVADHQADDRFALYASGFGSAVALQAFVNRPDRIDRMILQHGFAKRRLSVFERLLAMFCLRSGQTLNALPQRRRFQAVNHRPWFPPFDPSRFDFLVESSGSLPLRDLARRALAIHAFNLVAALPQISCPVLLLRTEGEGRQAAESAALLEMQLKSARIEWMHSAGQHPCLTHPHRVAKLVQSFIPSGTE